MKLTFFFGCIHKSSLSTLPPISDEAVIKNLLTGSESEQSVGLISSFLSSILLYSSLLLISLASYLLISDYNSVISVPWQKYHHTDHIHVVLALRGTHCTANEILLIVHWWEPLQVKTTLLSCDRWVDQAFNNRNIPLIPSDSFLPSFFAFSLPPSLPCFFQVIKVCRTNILMQVYGGW